MANLGIPAEHGLLLAAILFVIGLCGVMVRRNMLFMLMSLEIMMNAAALAFVVGGNIWGSPDGQVMFILVLTLAAAEAAIGLAILLQFYHRFKNLDITKVSTLKG
ncbi:MAG: NADH-quinone oxidoreductase subunit NuoK [Moraxella sp.]|nr:NADH-quinone oxidoreductase subunit NuoK [Moraxella sp.]